MNRLLTIITLVFALQACNEPKFNFEKSVWKACGNYPITDILVFDKGQLYVRNDSIFLHKNDSLIGVIDKKEYHINYDYNYNRLYVKNPKNGKTVRYCEQ